jgi:hypothetical protein
VRGGALVRTKGRWACSTAYTLLLLLWALLALGARHLSFTMDEPAHVARGYTFLARWQEGFWYFPFESHPPLINMGEALLTFLAQPDVPLETLAGWGNDFQSYVGAFTPYLVPLERVEVLARVPVMLLTVLLGALVFRWGRDLGGGWVGVGALGLLTLDPLMLAHGRLATTDAGVTVMGTAALYAGWRWLESASWRWAALTGGLLGLAMLTKFTGPLWSASFGLMASAVVLLRWRRDGLKRAWQTAVAGVIALFLIWVAFGLSFGTTGFLPLPLPAPVYWTALLNQTATAGGRNFYALGEIWVGRQWWYFPLNFLIRNPLPLLLTLPVAVWSLVRHNLARTRLWALGLFPCLYGLVFVTRGLNVSYRHMLPVHPFLYLVIAAGMGALIRARQCQRWLYVVLALLGGWYAFGTLRLFPDEIAYFNELVGGPERGHRYLVDRTQDWGQSHKELRAYLFAHPGPEPHVARYTRLDPGDYGVGFRPIFPAPEPGGDPAPFRPQPGRYVIGVTPLYGLTGYSLEQIGWFQRASPTAMVGHALLVYHVTEEPQWVAQCTTPAVPLDDAAIAAGWGRTDLRRADFDCTAAWLYPSGGTGMGVYALHHDLLTERGRCFPSLLQCDPEPPDAFVDRHLAGARLSYDRRRFGRVPAFALYERAADAPPLSALRPAQAARINALPADLGDVPEVTVPISLEGPVAFLGAAVYPVGRPRDGGEEQRDGGAEQQDEGAEQQSQPAPAPDRDGLEVETWWQVTDGPITRPFSVMAHLLGPDGVVLGTADGLGVSPLVLAPGDVVVQRHRFSRSEAGGALWLRTGVYWLDTMARWPVVGVPGDTALYVALEEEV